MKLPAVAIAASFLSGVIFGLHPFLTHRATSALRLITVCSFCLIITGMWLAIS